MADKVIVLSKDPSSVDQQINLVKGDNKTYTVQFCIQRTYGAVDMSTLNWGVNVKNAALEEAFIALNVASSDDNHIYLNWSIGVEATAEAGLSFYTVEGRNDVVDVNPIWRSSAMSINVYNAVIAPADIDPETADTISELASQLSSAIAAANTASANATQIATNAATQIENIAVRYDISQELTSAQKGTAQKNIGVDETLIDFSSTMQQREIIYEFISDNFMLDPTSTSGARSNSNASIKKFAVTEGDLLLLKIPNGTAGVWAFSSASDTSGLIQPIYTDGWNVFVRVPEGASWIFASTLKSVDAPQIYRLKVEAEEYLVSGGFINLSSKYVTSTQIGSSVDTYSIAVPCLPNQYYCISKPQGQRFAVACISGNAGLGGTPIIESTYVSNNRGTDASMDTNVLDAIGIVTPANATFIIVFYYINNGKEPLTQAQMLERTTIKEVSPGNNNYITPQMFGAVVYDQTQDDTTEKVDISNVFSEMVKYTSQHPEMRTIYMPAGAYYGCLKITNNNESSIKAPDGLMIHGDGRNTVLYSTSFDYRGINVEDVAHVIIRDMRIVSGMGKIADKTRAGYLAFVKNPWVGINLSRSNRSCVENVFIEALVHGISIYESNGIVVNTVFVTHIVKNPEFSEIDNSDPSDPNNPGKNMEFSVEDNIRSYYPLMPFICNNIAITIVTSYYVTLSNIRLDRVMCGVHLATSSTANKITDMEVNFAAGYAIRILKANPLIENVRVDNAGLYQGVDYSSEGATFKRFAIEVGESGTNIARFPQFSNVMVQHGSSGGLMIADNVLYGQFNNVALINNSSWYESFNYWRLSPQDTSPSGWKPNYEIVIGNNVGRLKLDAIIAANIESEAPKEESGVITGNWNGYSNGLQFAKSGNSFTQKTNDISILFGYDYDDPDGTQGTIPSWKKITPYPTKRVDAQDVPDLPTDTNRIVWNTVKLEQ